MKLDAIRRYARGTSPIIGIPVFHVGEGKHIAAIFLRTHLQAALAAPMVRASYDEKCHVLILNGGARASYRLRNLHHVEGYHPYQVREQLTQWAAGKKKSVASRGLGVDQKRAIKLQAQIAKLERAKEKIKAYKPHQPLLPTEWDLTPASDGDRRQKSHWRAEKSIRRQLGRLVRRERETGADFYHDVEQIIGRHVDSSCRHDRICNRRGGPDRLDYLMHTYRHVYLSTKPYERSSTWNHFRVSEYAGEDRSLNQFQQYRQAQVEYLGIMRERSALDSMIAGLKAQIADMVGEVAQ